MILSPKSLEKLRLLINEETEYRSGPQLVRFFNDLGFKDSYGQGFPSRWVFTDDKLQSLNGSPELDKCIRTLLNPVNFIGRIEELDKHIGEFNKFLTFDKWRITRNGPDIEFTKQQKIEIDESPATGRSNKALQLTSPVRNRPPWKYQPDQLVSSGYEPNEVEGSPVQSRLVPSDGRSVTNQSTPRDLRL